MTSIKHRIRDATLTVAFTAVLASEALAAMPGFRTADGNGDGVVSLKEFQAHGGQEQAFRGGDADRDQRLSSDEYAEASADNERIATAQYVDDAWITASVKAALLKEAGVKGLDVNVETHKGTVQLSGSVGSPNQVAQAERLARGVRGVKGIRNDLRLKR